MNADHFLTEWQCDTAKHDFLASKTIRGYIEALASTSFSMMHCWGRLVLANTTKAYPGLYVQIHKTTSVCVRMNG